MGRSVSRTVARFAAVGVANTLIDVTLFWILQPALGIVVANLLSTSAGAGFSFVVNGRHTFGAQRLTLRQGLLFVGTNACSMWLLQPLVIYAAHAVAGVPLMPGKVLALGGGVAANFLLYRYVVWPPGQVTSEPRPAGPSAAPVGARR